ncbi:MAG: hypothetical protein ABL995_04815 [Bryobacteraceae bacterium]
MNRIVARLVTYPECEMSIRSIARRPSLAICFVIIHPHEIPHTAIDQWENRQPSGPTFYSGKKRQFICGASATVCSLGIALDRVKPVLYFFSKL